MKVKCFSADSTVQTDRGRMRLADLYASNDQHVRVLTAGGHFSPVTLWLHAEPESPAEFLRLTTATGRSLSVTRGHLVFRTSCEGPAERQAVQAGKIATGDCLMVDSRGQLEAQQVVSVEKFDSVGFYSPVTASGDLLVDDFLASCYSEVEAVQLQSLMFGYIDAVKSAAQQLLPTGIFSAVFGQADNSVPLAEAVGQFLGLSEKFIA